jgi:cytidylate kinase
MGDAPSAPGGTGQRRRSRPVVAIDGPAGAGKSTVARGLADTLGFVLVDTGAMYRAVALAAERRGIRWDDATAVGDLARSLVTRRGLGFARDPNAGVRVRLEGDDVTDAIRTGLIAMGASTVSAHKPVRDALFDMQRQAGEAGGVVLEGRDIGTVVFPDAEVKIFLTARTEVRARRRYDELVAKGKAVTFEETLEDIRRRDEQDSTRPLAPLQRAGDAILLDNSDITVEETVARIVAAVRGAAAR